MLVGAYTFLDAIWTMFIFFACILLITWVILLMIDNFRRRDHSGAAKAGWAILLIFLPVIGAVAYTITRPDILDPELAYEPPLPTSSGNGPGSTTAAELARLSELRAEGAISDTEYEELKAKTIASA